MDGQRHHSGVPSVSLIIPAHNEQDCIGQAIAEADQALNALGYEFEIIVVDDGSQDATRSAALQAARSRPSVRVLSHSENRGYGAALRTGFEAARFNLVAFTDADCQFDLTDLGCLVPWTEQFPLVVGHRVDRQDPLLRRLLSRGYNQLARTLLGTRVRDCDCALKVFRKDALAQLLPESAGFFVNTEMLARARQLGLDIHQVGVQHRPRLKGRSKVSLTEVPKTLGTLVPFYWTKILFPGRQPDASREKLNGPLVCCLLVLVACLLFYSQLRTPLLEPEEARYAELPRQMLAEGRWVVPFIHGQPYSHKPPLLYWLVMGSYSLFGVHDWAARLVPSTCGFLTVLLTYAWGKRVVGHRGGLASAFILCLSAAFIYRGRMLTMDSLLCLWVIATLAAGHCALNGRDFRWGWWAFSAGTCGLGILTKGPVALALIGVPLLGFVKMDRRAPKPRLRWWLAYLGVAACVACPWYVTVAVRDPAFLRDFFWIHNIRRFLAPIDHQEPVWFYLPGLFLGMLPWSVVLWPLARFLGKRSKEQAERRPPALGFFLLSFLWCLLFFSVSGCKRAGYILPALPCLALALGSDFDIQLPRNAELPAKRRLLAFHGATGWVLCGACTFLGLFAALQVLLPVNEQRFSLRRQVQPHFQVAQDLQVPVVCFPRRWDSVSFYLSRNDVRAYGPDQEAQLVADLQTRPRTLLFVKSDQALPGFLHRLPRDLEFVPGGQLGTVTGGLVQRRGQVSDFMIARNDSQDHARLPGIVQSVMLLSLEARIRSWGSQ